MDQEGAFRGTGLHDWCGERGIELDFVPAEHHESTGDVERAIGELRKKMMAHLRNEDVTPRQAAWSMCSAHNHVARVGGFSPAQWALEVEFLTPTICKLIELMRCTVTSIFDFELNSDIENYKPKPKSAEL